MYKILINAGTENFYFIAVDFKTAESALEYAMTLSANFMIVKLINFREA